jgi:PTS system cellobiose-specific IIC component
MASGIVNRTFVEPGWNMFAPIGALISTLDFKALVLILILIVLDGLVYYPFLKVYDKKLFSEESQETEVNVSNSDMEVRK